MRRETTDFSLVGSWEDSTEGKYEPESGGWAESTEAETFGSICLEVEAIGSVMSRDANVAELSMSIGSEEGGTTGSEKRQGVYFF